MDFYRFMVLLYFIFLKDFIYVSLCGYVYAHECPWRSEDVRTHGTGLLHCEHPMWMLQADLRFSLQEDSEVLLTTESPLHPCTVS